jgi:hypothetical protein
MKDVMKYFGYKTAGEFKKDWVQLTIEDKTQLIQGITDGTLTY